jgi:hypothetical protein
VRDEVESPAPRTLAETDITVAVIFCGDDEGGAVSETLRHVVEQGCPWEVEVLVLGPDASLPTSLPSSTRTIAMENRDEGNSARDRAAAEASSDILIFLAAGNRPHSERWLTDLTDPFFEGEDVAVISVPVLGEGESISEAAGRTWHRHDTADARLDVDLGAMAVRRDVARRISFVGETGSSWMEEVLSSGHPHRFIPSLPVVRGEGGSPAPMEKRPAPEPLTPAPPAPEAPLPPAREPVIIDAPPATPVAEEAPGFEAPRPAQLTTASPDMGSLWRLPAHVAGRTFERWIHAAVDSQERSVSNVLKAPFSATKDVLTDYRRGGASIPGCFTRDE